MSMSKRATFGGMRTASLSSPVEPPIPQMIMHWAHTCETCGKFCDIVQRSVPRYCPNCGAFIWRRFRIPFICKNSGTSLCRQCEDNLSHKDYNLTICEKCDADGGFSI